KATDSEMHASEPSSAKAEPASAAFAATIFNIGTDASGCPTHALEYANGGPRWERARPRTAPSTPQTLPLSATALSPARSRISPASRYARAVQTQRSALPPAPG